LIERHAGKKSKGCEDDPPEMVSDAVVYECAMRQLTSRSELQV
jgi:hypothetical protein